MAKIQCTISVYSTNVSNADARAIEAQFQAFTAACVRDYVDLRCPSTVIVSLDPDPEPEPVPEPVIAAEPEAVVPDPVVEPID